MRHQLMDREAIGVQMPVWTLRASLAGEALGLGQPEVARVLAAGDPMEQAGRLEAIANGLARSVVDPVEWLHAPNYLLSPHPYRHLWTEAGLVRIHEVVKLQQALTGGRSPR